MVVLCTLPCFNTQLCQESIVKVHLQRLVLCAVLKQRECQGQLSNSNSSRNCVRKNTAWARQVVSCTNACKVVYVWQWPQQLQHDGP